MNKRVKLNEDMFIDVVGEGCYPFYPITVRTLENTMLITNISLLINQYVIFV